MKKLYSYTIVFLSSLLFFSCGGSKKGATASDKTGFAYNKKEFGGFEVNTKFKRGPGPGLVAIEGGEFIMGGSAIDVPGQDLNDYNYKREVSVSSFYMDETEVSNTNWLEYLNWVNQRFGTTQPELYYNALPDTLVWRRPLSYNEPYVNNYLRHPAYQDYPVVGVSWEQAKLYCIWRTNRVNEFILRSRGILPSFAELSKKPGSNEIFDTSFELNNQDILARGKNPLRDINSTAKGKAAPARNVRLEDGILQEPYRLPTEAEWEYAALGLIGNTQYGNINQKKIYPWNGLGITSAKKGTRGLILANFKRGKGDYMGVGGSLNDKGSITVPVRNYEPNDFGLYNMAGNVNEWVEDVFRPSTYQLTEGLNPVRGNEYMDKKRNDQGQLEKDPKGIGTPTMIPALSGVKQEYIKRTLKDSSYVNNYKSYRDEQSKLTNVITLVSDSSRVYKGGSWDDQAMWLNPATRRHFLQYESSADIGFRCAMTMIGAPEVSSKGKPQFKSKSTKPFKAK